MYLHAKTAENRFKVVVRLVGHRRSSLIWSHCFVWVYIRPPFLKAFIASFASGKLLWAVLFTVFLTLGSRNFALNSNFSKYFKIVLGWNCILCRNSQFKSVSGLELQLQKKHLRTFTVHSISLFNFSVIPSNYCS